MSEIKLTVYFDEPFWTGVFERTENGRLSASKVVFGAEPKDAEVWDFVLKQFRDLPFSPTVERVQRQTADNPKRRQRNARRQLESAGVGTKSQQALAAQREENKLERRRRSREEKLEEKQRFEQKQQRKKEKHRGH